MSIKAQRETCKLRILDHVRYSGNVAFICRYFGISGETFTGGKEIIKVKEMLD